MVKTDFFDSHIFMATDTISRLDFGELDRSPRRENFSPVSKDDIHMYIHYHIPLSLSSPIVPNRDNIA